MYLPLSVSLTSLIQGMKEATLVNIVGFWGVLHPLPLTKLVTPSTYHLPSLPLQFRGPPESPWKMTAQGWAQEKIVLFVPHIASSCVVVSYMACWLALSSCTDHCCLGWAAPPVILTADTVIHHREQGLLQGSCLGTSSWREKITH